MMKRLLAVLLLAFAGLALAQNQAINQRPASGGKPIGGSITGTCTTANAVLYNAATPCSANLTFSSSTNRVTVSAGTNEGLIFGYGNGSSSGSIWSANAGAKDRTDYAFNAAQTSTGINATANGNIYMGFGGDGNTSFQLKSSGAHVLTGNVGAGLTITAGIAATAVNALSITQTNNNAAVVAAVKITVTDTTSAAGFLPFQILGGSGATTNLLSVPKEGGIAVKAKIHSGTAPTIASGGCTSPTVTNENGTAHFTIDVGTSCSGSQPVVFTLPAATTGWDCYARNVTNPATSVPAQTGAASTTSVTFTNYARTTGLAAAWTDGDDIVVSCLGG